MPPDSDICAAPAAHAAPAACASLVKIQNLWVAPLAALVALTPWPGPTVAARVNR